MSHHIREGVLEEGRTDVKSAEAWQAGGPYFVLRGADGDRTTARPAPPLTPEALRPWLGRRVRVRGHQAEGTPYQPASPFEQYPVGPSGAPLARGGAFLIEAIEAADN